MDNGANETRYNRVLFRGMLGWIPRPGGKGHCVDGSSLAFIIEELVAHCAVGIVIPNLSPASLFVDTLDPLLSKRIRIVPFEPVMGKLQALLEPLTEEFCVSFDGTAISSPCEDKEAEYALAMLYFELLEYFLGLEYRTEVDVNMQDLGSAIRLLRAYSRNPRSRAVLATLEGLLAVYVPLKCGGLVASPAASSDIARLFNDLVEDRLYLGGSEAAHGLGLPKKAIRSVMLLRRFVEKIATSTRFRQLFSLGTKAVTAATNLPMPDCAAAAEILSSGFLPPIVSLRKSVDAALAAWKESGSGPVYPPRVSIGKSKPK